MAQDCWLSTGAAYGRDIIASSIPALGTEMQYIFIYSMKKKKKNPGMVLNRVFSTGGVVCTEKLLFSLGNKGRCSSCLVCPPILITKCHPTEMAGLLVLIQKCILRVQYLP